MHSSSYQRLVPIIIPSCMGIALVLASSSLLAVPGTKSPDTGQPKEETKGVVTISVYDNSNNRPDPFLPVGMKRKGPEAEATLSDTELKLQGILWDPEKPIAIINRQRVGLNQTVSLALRAGEVTVTAIAIQRDKVVLKLDKRQIELELDHDSSASR